MGGFPVSYITVTMDNGKQEKLEVLERIDIANKHYVIVAPEDSDLAYAYRVTVKGKFEEYESVGAGKEFDAVLKKYNEIVANS